MYPPTRLTPMWRLLPTIALMAATSACARPVESATRTDTTFIVRGGDGQTQAATRAAADALAEGHPFEATRRLAPLMADPARRTPEAVLLAAAAAARWDGWPEVERLLGREPWVDSLFEGRGRELLARAALARGNDTLAARHADAAVAAARSEPMRSVRVALRARAFDRLSRLDEAARDYEDAAEHLPEVADWLRLREAGVLADASRRRALYDGIRTEVARSRIAVTEAQALARARDYAAAAVAYDSLGLPARALRMRFLAAGGAAADSARRAALRREALDRLDRARGDTARELIDLLDDALAPLSPAEEERRVARAAAASGSARRAATGFARALAGAGAKAGTKGGTGSGATLDAADRLAYGTALARLGDHRGAAAQLALVPPGTPQYDEAAYGRARSLLRTGSGGTARALLGTLARGGGARAASARFLLADLATDDGREAEARRDYRALAAASPSSPLASESRFRAAMLAYAAGDARAAALELDTLAERHPRSDDALAALYWSGRAWEAAKDATKARERWREVIRRDAGSYYAVASARRLETAPWTPPPASAADTNTDPALAALVRRMDALATLGFATERDIESDEAGDAATRSREPARMLATGEALSRAGMPWRGTRLARAALAAGAPRDRRAYRLLYPLPDPVLLRRAADAERLDPALVAALIHQESGFNPRATSVAGALGLMQVLPDVGREIAAARGYPTWDRVLLYEPEVSLELGTAHLAQMLRSYADLAYALAAYNAGQSPVRRWRALRGSEDPELFVERIPYDETRDYVRILTRNRVMYERLYGDPATGR